MQKFKSVVAVALAVVTIASVFSSCSKKSSGATAEDIDGERGNTLSILRSGLDQSDKTHPVIKAINRFQDEYGRDVEFVTCGYDEWSQKITASIASGDPIDVVNADAEQYPLFAMKKYAQPISKFINLNSDYIDLPIMDAMFSYKDEYYNAVAKNCSIPLVIYYNKNMFENEGMDEPIDLYKKGEWNFKNFKQIAKDFTKDTNGDGALDQWGLAAWYQWTFFGGSGASVCTINKDGLYELNLDNNPALDEALGLIKSAWFDDKFVGLEGNDIYDSFYKGKNAMINEFTWAEQNIIKAKEKGQFSFEYGVVPFPYGEENKDKVNYCFSDGFSILNGSDTPYSAGKLIDIILEENVKDAEADEVKIPKENAELYRDLRKKPFNSQYYDSAIEAGKALCTLVGQGTNITQAKEQIKPVYQGYIDDANVPTEDPKPFDFTTIEANFDNGIDGFLPASKENVKLKNEDGALKAEMTTNVYGESLKAIKTDPKVYPISGWKKYKVSFKYKVEKIPNAAVTAYNIRIAKDQKPYTAYTFTPDPKSVNEYVTFETEIEGVPDNSTELYLMLTGVYADSIYIDDFKMEEVKKK